MKHLQKQDGFSLIEILVALTLGSLLVIAFTGAFVVGLQTEDEMDERMEVMRDIDSVIEELRNKELLSAEEIEVEYSDQEEGYLKGEITLDSHLEFEDVNYDENNQIYSLKIGWKEGNYSTETLVSTGTGTVPVVGEYTLTIDIAGEGTTDPAEGKHDYEDGEEVDLNAYPDEGREFYEWTGDVESTEEDITVSMNENKEITAVFEGGGEVEIFLMDDYNDWFEIGVDNEEVENVELNYGGDTDSHVELGDPIEEEDSFRIEVEDSHKNQTRDMEAEYFLDDYDASLTLELHITSEGEIESIEEI